MYETHSKILIFFKNEHLHLSNILNWLRTAPEFDAYKFHSITSTKHDGLSFKEKLFIKCFEKDMLQKPPIYITIFDKQGHEVLINKGRQITSLSIRLHSLTTQRTFEDWLKFTDGFFESKIGIAACVYPKDDFFWQRNTDLGQYKKYGKSTEDLQTIQKNKSTTIINPKTLPGFPMYVDEIWFGSTWMMWFGPEYYNYIPRERLLQFKQAFQTKVFDNGSIFIQLYESGEDVEKEESRQVQWAFRNFFSINLLVEHLRQSEQRRMEEHDPVIEIFTQNCQHGGVRLLKMYLNESKRNVPRSEAKTVVAFEINAHGETVWSEEKGLE